MNHFTPSPHIPAYRGQEWIDVPLPVMAEPWPAPTNGLFSIVVDGESETAQDDVRRYVANKPWVSPRRTIFFLCDVHADAAAFARSLVASGGVEKTGPRPHDFALAPAASNAVFVIGGDCFDKGPKNLPLLRTIEALLDKGAEVELLAGNHDLRALLGLVYAERKDDPLLAHLFVRMGPKSVPLFKEVYDQYIARSGKAEPSISADEVRARLFPDESWYHDFPAVADGLIPAPRIRKEVRRIAEKVLQFEERCRASGMTLPMVYAAVEKCRALFLEPDGAFGWFFNQLELGYRAGSYLFIHAGVDDTTAELIYGHGVDGLNWHFKRMMADDLFGLYHGPIGNSFRTKYRDIDWPLSHMGVTDLHRAGIYAIVHGHRNSINGQRLMMRRGMLNFECDASIDRNTRRAEGLQGPGGAVTIFKPDGRVLGISTDHPYVKVFDPSTMCRLTTIV